MANDIKFVFVPIATVCISAKAYEKMLRDDGIAVLCAERKQLADQNAQLELKMKANSIKITALTSTIAALQLVKDDK